MTDLQVRDTIRPYNFVRCIWSRYLPLPSSLRIPSPSEDLCGNRAARDLSRIHSNPDSRGRRASRCRVSSTRKTQEGERLICRTIWSVVLRCHDARQRSQSSFVWLLRRKTSALASKERPGIGLPTPQFPGHSLLSSCSSIACRCCSLAVRAAGAASV